MSSMKIHKKAEKKKVEFLLSVIVGLVIAGLLRGFVFMNVNVPSESMEPTIMTNDKLIGSKLAYLVGAPKRGDIITFDSPDVPDVTYLKRIIGLPGETLTILDGKVYINESSTPLDEPYINQTETPKGDYGPYLIPKDSYFVMGDNRNNSLDSRFFEATHFISKDAISSKISVKYSPKIQKIE